MSDALQKEIMDTALQVKTDENDRRLAALNELRSDHVQQPIEHRLRTGDSVTV